MYKWMTSRKAHKEAAKPHDTDTIHDAWAVKAHAALPSGIHPSRQHAVGAELVQLPMQRLPLLRNCPRLLQLLLQLLHLLLQLRRILLLLLALLLLTGHI
jgi:hypothetical protein